MYEGSRDRRRTARKEGGSERVNETTQRTTARPRRRPPGTSPILSYGSAFLAVTVVAAGWRIWVLEKQVDGLEAANTSYAEELLRTRREMSDALVRGAAARAVDERDAQALRARHPDEAELLSTILSLAREGVTWSETGDNRSTGFHSAAFVGHVLRATGHTMGFLELASDPAVSRDKLFQNLRYKASPAVGDLVFYPGDMVLFYFADRNGRPFVVGMTPRGIRALSPDFVEPLGFREFRFAGRVRS